jgi:ribosomal protein S18 acetylase RimI-like enzyme
MYTRENLVYRGVMKTYKGLIIKQFNSNNLNELLELETEIQANLEHKDQYGGPTKESCLKTLEDKENLLLGIYNKQDELMAYTTLKRYKYFSGIKYLGQNYFNVPDEKVYWFLNVAVKPKFRGQNIQNKIVDHHIEYAKQKGAQFMVAYVHPENKFSKNNFLKKGFKVLKTVTFDDGRIRDIIGIKI